MASEQFAIVDGPAKWDFCLALFDGDSNHRRKVGFTITVNNFRDPVQVFINKVGREDGSGESWLFWGYVAEGLRPEPEVYGYFSTKTRRGWLKFGREEE